jgi:putative transferase (TIGR04331 family)
MEYSIDLLEHLAKDTKYSVKARFYPLDNGWNLEKRLMKKTNKIRIDDYSKTFIDTAQESKIVIVDAISTSWAETLAMNIPLLIVIPKFLDIYSEHGTELFNKLKSIGLYYNSYEEVVDTLNKIDDIDAWWATKQDTLNLIRKKYCWCADNPKKEWIDEFIKISKE